MHKATISGQLEVIKFLSPMFGARVHEQDSNGFTILHWAAAQGHCQVAHYLIEELKIDPEVKNKVCEVLEKGVVSKVQDPGTYVLTVADTSNVCTCDVLNSVTL